MSKLPKRIIAILLTPCLFAGSVQAIPNPYLQSPCLREMDKTLFEQQAIPGTLINFFQKILFRNKPKVESFKAAQESQATYHDESRESKSSPAKDDDAKLKRTNELLGIVRNYTEEINEENVFEIGMKYKDDAILTELNRLAGEIRDLGVRREISQTTFELLKKLRLLPAFFTASTLPHAIEIIGNTRIATPEMGQTILYIFQNDWKRENEREGIAYLRNVIYAGAALGKLYGPQAYRDLMAYKNYVVKGDRGLSGLRYHPEAVLWGVVSGFGEMNSPEAVKEIFLILTMQDAMRFYEERKRDAPKDLPLYHGSFAIHPIEYASDAIGHTDESTVKRAFQENFTDRELADLLTKYHRQGETLIGNFGVSYTECLLKLALPYIVPTKLINALALIDPSLREEVVRYASYGMKADLVELARARRLDIPNLEKYDVVDLRRKQRRLDEAQPTWAENPPVSEDHLYAVLSEIDSAIHSIEGGAIGSAGATHAGNVSGQLREYVLPVAPAVGPLIKGGSVAERIQAAQELQHPVILEKLIQIIVPMGTIIDAWKLLALVLKLNKEFSVRFLSERILGERRGEGGFRHEKRYASLYLGVMRDERALPFLIREALYSPIPMDRYRAVEAIRDIGSPWAFEFLVDIFHETEWSELRSVCIEALGGIKDPLIIEFLRFEGGLPENQEHQSDFVYALARSGDQEAIERLLRIMEANVKVAEGLSPASIASQLWKITLPKAEFKTTIPSVEAANHRKTIRRIGIHTIHELAAVKAEQFDSVGPFRINHYDYYAFYHNIVGYFDRLTALPVGEAQQILSDAFPQDEDYLGFVFSFLESLNGYPRMREVLIDAPRTQQLISQIRDKAARDYYAQRHAKQLPKPEATNAKSVTLSNGMVVEKQEHPNAIIVFPFTDLLPDLFRVVREGGITESSVQEVLDKVRSHIKSKLGREIAPIKADVVPHHVIMSLPTGKPHTKMVTFFHPLEKHQQIFISDVNSRDMPPEEFVLGFIHEVFSLAIVPEGVYANLLEHGQDYVAAVYSSHIFFISEGLANFQTNLPFTMKIIKDYAEGLRDGNLEQRLKTRGVVDQGIAHAIKSDWYVNPHPLGFLLFEALSRVNAEQMWEYAFNFIEKNMNGNYSLSNLQRTNFAHAMYDDYEKLTRSLGEEPYPAAVFFPEQAEAHFAGAWWGKKVWSKNAWKSFWLSGLVTPINELLGHYVSATISNQSPSFSWIDSFWNGKIRVSGLARYMGAVANLAVGVLIAVILGDHFTLLALLTHPIYWYLSYIATMQVVGGFVEMLDPRGDFSPIHAKILQAA